MAEYDRHDPRPESPSKSPSWYRGRDKAMNEERLDMSLPYTEDFIQGFEDGLKELHSEGKIDTARMLWLQNKRPKVTIPVADTRSAEEQDADAARHGYEEAVDLMRMDPHIGYTASQRLAYMNGYHRGMMEKVDSGSITINRARELMGMPEFQPPLTKFDPVKAPGHYNSGTIEVTNFITDQQLDFPRGNVVKYVARAGKKDPANEIQDLEKAAAYLQMAHNLANGKPAVVRDPVTREVVWSLFNNEQSTLDRNMEIVKQELENEQNRIDRQRGYIKGADKTHLMGSDGRDHLN